jgi:hypothetical protein
MLVLAGSLALAVEPPSPPPHGKTKQQQKWLRDHLRADMRIINTFPDKTYGSMAFMVNSATGNETDLLADCYQLPRKIAEQEMRQIAQAQIAQAQALQVQAAQAQGVQPQAVQPQAAPPQEDEEAKADREDLRKLYKRLAEARKAVRNISEYIYASLPGWCAQAAQYVPSSYYGNGRYVGPLDSAAYAGPYAGDVYNAYSDNASYFNTQIIRGRASLPDVPRRTNPNSVVPQGNRPGQNGPASRGTNQRPVGFRSAVVVSPMSVTTMHNGSWQGSGCQGPGATQYGHGR